MTEVRTRFAPSPTGALHLGSAHTALYCWLYARRFGGKFILRIEDTDRERSTQENVEVILNGMRWLELDWDEGPFYQSQRNDQYRKAADELIAKGMAYRCTCKAEDLEAKRQQARADKRTYLYDRTCREAGHGPDCGPHVVRFKMPIDGVTAFEDSIKGHVEYPNSELDDWIILRTDGTPTYNFCVVVDDMDMRITHVIRGDDHLNNTPKQFHLYEALDYPKPIFAHMPLIHGKDGSKLSKRHGATSVMAYCDLGYLPIAVRNYLARLGWGHGDQELFTDEEMIQWFDVKDISRSPAVFDIEKFAWVNEQQMKKVPREEITRRLLPLLKARGYEMEPGPKLSAMIDNYIERARTLVEMIDKWRYLLEDQVEYDPKAAEKFLKADALLPLNDLREGLAGLESFDEKSMTPVFEQLLEKHSIQFGKIAQPVRVAVTGSSASPGIFETLEMVGKERVLARLDRAIQFINNRGDQQRPS